MNNSYKIMFFLMMMLGTMITVSSNSWLSAWMGLEINLLAFIPLMSDNNLMSTESSLKYFLVQALASTVFLFSSMLMNMEFLFMNNPMMEITSTMISSSLFLKLGASPFHFWFPNVMSGLSWINSLILMTWQKIAPFLMISYLMNYQLMLMVAFLSSVFGAVGGLNQTILNKLMAYSSINHISWMMIALIKSENYWMMYFLFYSLLSITLIMLFYMFNISHVNQMYILSMNSKPLKYLTFMNLLSLGGLPPFTGFIPKWLIIDFLSTSGQLFILFTLILMTILTLFFYLRLSYSAFMISSSSSNWIYNFYVNNSFMKIYLILSTLSIFGMIMITYIM